MNNQSELSLVLRRFHGVFWAIGAFSLAINVLLLVPSLYMLQVYDRVLSSRNMTTLLMLSLIMLGLFALESALEFVRSRVLVRMSVALDVALAPRLLPKVTRALIEANWRVEAEGKLYRNTGAINIELTTGKIGRAHV